MVTTSPDTTPDNEADDKSTVADVASSNTLLDATIPETDNALASTVTDTGVVVDAAS